MGRKPKIIFEEKLKAVEDYLCKKRNRTQIYLELSIYRDTFHCWVNKYKIFGRSGLRTSSKNISYDKTVRLQAVTYSLKGTGSYQHISNIYNISSHSILSRWIKKYNGHEISKSHKVAEDKNMANRRKTTSEERVDIVAFCIGNDYNYDLASKRFDVSYQQVYSWVKKYKKHGYEGLTDKRGKCKEIDQTRIYITITELGQEKSIL